MQSAFTSTLSECKNTFFSRSMKKFQKSFLIFTAVNIPPPVGHLMLLSKKTTKFFKKCREFLLILSYTIQSPHNSAMATVSKNELYITMNCIGNGVGNISNYKCFYIQDNSHNF